MLRMMRKLQYAWTLEREPCEAALEFLPCATSTLFPSAKCETFNPHNCMIFGHSLA